MFKICSVQTWLSMVLVDFDFYNNKHEQLLFPVSAPYNLDILKKSRENRPVVADIIPVQGAVGVLKRVEDVIVSLLVLIIIAIPMLIIGLGVKLSSPGRVLFRQRRHGLNGKIIWIWKFRTMTVCEDGASVKQAQRNDKRVTRFGAFLRRTSLDELPQFINVLQGQMSVVGPRPHAILHNEYYRRLIPKYMSRHVVKPGITGWAQVNGFRGETKRLEDMKNRVIYDFVYIGTWSLWFDIEIIILTIFTGFVDPNAY